MINAQPKDMEVSSVTHRDHYYVVVNVEEEGIHNHYLWQDGKIRPYCHYEGPIGINDGYYATEQDAKDAITKYFKDRAKLKRKKDKKGLTKGQVALNKGQIALTKHLILVSGLHCEVHRQDGESFCFDFYTDKTKSQAVKSVFTYPKAKLFAEGVAMGRKLESENLK